MRNRLIGLTLLLVACKGAPQPVSPNIGDFTSAPHISCPEGTTFTEEIFEAGNYKLCACYGKDHTDMLAVLPCEQAGIPDELVQVFEFSVGNQTQPPVPNIAIPGPLLRAAVKIDGQPYIQVECGENPSEDDKYALTCMVNNQMVIVGHVNIEPNCQASFTTVDGAYEVCDKGPTAVITPDTVSGNEIEFAFIGQRMQGVDGK